MRNLYTIKHCAYARYVSLWHNIDFLAAHKPFASPYCGLINANFARCQLFFPDNSRCVNLNNNVFATGRGTHIYTYTHTWAAWELLNIALSWSPSTTCLTTWTAPTQKGVWSVFGLRCKDHSIGFFLLFTWKLFVSTFFFFFLFLRIQPTANFTINKRRTKPASAACSSANKLLVPRNSLAPPLPHTSL